MNNLEIYNLYNALFNLSRSEEIQLPVKVGYLIVKNRNLLEPFFNALNSAREKVIQQYAEKDESGEYQISEEKVEEANKELEQILLLEEDHVFLQKIKIKDIEKALPMNIINDLMPILEE